jgi:hypothetical protein
VIEVARVPILSSSSSSKVIALGRRDREVVECEQIDARQLSKAPGEAAIAVRDAKLFPQPWCAY